MKRKSLLIALCILLLASAAYAMRDYCKSSYTRSSDALIFDGKCYLVSVLVITDGTNDATVSVHDALNAGSNQVFPVTVSGASDFGGRIWMPPLEMRNGIYVNVSGTGAKYIVEYVEK